MKMLSFLLMVCLFPLMVLAEEGAEAPIRIVLVGDSTVREYAPERPVRGWGMYFEERFRKGSIELINRASSGRSTKTFIQEGRWRKALRFKPDYVLIQFGHNDSHAPERPAATDANTEYKDYLRRYVDETRAIGATPILITPMVRRKFSPEGGLADALAPYAQAMKEVAAERQAALIDLHASSKELVEQLGREKSAEMANAVGDDTHFNEKGARAMAELIFRDLPTAAPRLAALLKEPQAEP